MPKTAQANWDDLRFVLAVAESGSVSSAARELGVNHATVLRRIAAFETRHGIRVFDRSPQGYRVSSDRTALIEAMREAAGALNGVERLIENERPRLAGNLRITSTDTLCLHLLPDCIDALASELGGEIDIISSNTHIDFERLEADITVRPALKLPESLDGEIACDMAFGHYRGEGGGHDWFGISGPPARSVAGQWMRANVDPGAVVATTDSFLTLATLAATRGANALLPVFLGDSTPGLRRVSQRNPFAPVPIWVASHVDFARSGRLRKARGIIVKTLQTQSDRFMGR